MAEFMPIRQRKISSVRSGINERNCKELLRFNSESVDHLAAQFAEESDTRGGGISRRQQMEIFLRFVGDAGFQSGVAQDVGVHPEDMTEAKDLWQRHFRWPSVIGAHDSTQIEIQKPGLHGDFE
ncbi:hypothetical protein WA026_010157 [Henosepilachna vigintioctopunctata]|uniref:Uncharacterized protein n=1 Tax=Henosepilachna vigintioctopunctata TaxID=420089 RepID=A0AAW1UCL8_9CUCU